MTRDAPSTGSAPDGASDDALMRAFSSGDSGAFERLFQRHRRPLFTFLLHHSGSRGTADDLFQEVFLRLIQSRAQYQPTGSFRAWLFTIAHNVMADDRRRAALRTSPHDGLAPGRDRDGAEAWEEALVSRDGRGDPVARSHAGDLRRHIEAALLRLPEAQREVFLLRERGGLDLGHIAEVTGANLATVKSRLRYALAGLRRLLSAELAALPESSHE